VSLDLPSLDSYCGQSDQRGRRGVGATSCYEHDNIRRVCFVRRRTDSAMFDFIDSCLRHKNEMVIYEAASTIVSLKCVTPKELSAAVNVLQLFISSPKPVLRYAAVRTLNKVSRTSRLVAINTRLSRIFRLLFNIRQPSRLAMLTWKR
jgi:hypothetical protein